MLMLLAGASGLQAGQAAESTALDQRIQQFMDSQRGRWRDMNVPASDGQALRDLIIEKGFKNALEIGTSTGHSGIWIAWGLARTGGKLTTVEIDPERHRIAKENFARAGVSDYVDARLADAHELVPRLEGPFDFVFSDADKDWYTRYFIAVWPKVSVGGCFVAHNVSQGMWGMDEFLRHLRTVKNGRTTFDERSRAGMSITCKTGS
jgi:predicted O-methyltransferase YrrM